MLSVWAAAKKSAERVACCSGSWLIETPKGGSSLKEESRLRSIAFDQGAKVFPTEQSAVQGHLRNILYSELSRYAGVLAFGWSRALAIQLKPSQNSFTNVGEKRCVSLKATESRAGKRGQVNGECSVCGLAKRALCTYPRSPLQPGFGFLVAKVSGRVRWSRSQRRALCLLWRSRTNSSSRSA